MAELTIVGGPGAGRRVTVDSEIVLGRAQGDVLIEDLEVSRRHASVRPAGTGVEIEDLGSTNGTFVNGRRIQGIATVSPGAVIRIGQTSFEVERVVAPTVESPASPASVVPGPSTEQLPASVPPGHRPLPVYRESNRGRVIVVVVVMVLLVAGAGYTFFLRGTSRDEYLAAAQSICKDTAQKLQRVSVRINAPYAARARAAGRAHGALRAAFADIRGLGRPEEGARKLARFVRAYGAANARLLGYRRALERAFGRIEVKARREAVERRRRRAISSRRRRSVKVAQRRFVAAAGRSRSLARASGVKLCGRMIQSARERVA